MKHTIQNMLAILALTFMAGSALAADEQPNVVKQPGNEDLFKAFVTYFLSNGTGSDGNFQRVTPEANTVKR